MKSYLAGVVLSIFLIAGLPAVNATKLLKASPVDTNSLVIHWQDGTVEYNWDHTEGSCNGWGPYHTEKWSLCPDKDQYIPYGEPLDSQVAVQPSTYSLVSDIARSPIAVYRKSKVWEASHDERKPAMHHWIYLKFAHNLKPGETYTLKINRATNSDRLDIDFTFIEAEMVSPAIKISNIGYDATASHKTADLYLWAGDGGAWDFQHLEGTPFHLVNIDTGSTPFTGKVEFYAKQGPEPGTDKDLTGADVWQCDFSSFTQPGTYRLVVEGLGSSYPFDIGPNRYEEAFKVAMQGMFYQRMGCEEDPAGGFPKARQPLYKQGVDPEGFTVYISGRNMVTGVNPDNMPWYAEASTGRVAHATWGGWSDAYDNDQRPVNYICVFDILLTYYLNPAAFSDGQLYIPETDNGIPDILDEALWEIDWWLRMRDHDGGYLSGLANITPPKTVNYAGAACAWQGYCVAAGSAMVADCFRRAGMTSLQWIYADSAQAAFNWAEAQTNRMLDDAAMELRGRDLRMTAAAFLFNLTGDRKYEEIVKVESVVSGPDSLIRRHRAFGQQYASTAYILTPQKVTYPELQANMKASILNQARTGYVDRMKDSPTKAARDLVNGDGVALTMNEMSLVAIAHHLSDDPAAMAYYAKGLYSEAEWTLGRNPLGLVLMTGLGDRCVTQTFAPGRRDGAPGLTPGWTPYMMRDGWKDSDDIHRCEWYIKRNYPDDKLLWPLGEHFWNSRYSVPNSETTPQQSARQKILLYGYLYAMSGK